MVFNRLNTYALEMYVYDQSFPVSVFLRAATNYQQLQPGTGPGTRRFQDEWFMV